MSSRSRRSCRYRQPPTNGLVSLKQPSSNNDAQSTSGASRWSIRSTSTWATIKKQRFSGIKKGKQPSASSFAAAVKHQAEKDNDIASVASMNATEPLLGMNHSLPLKKKKMPSSPFTFNTGSSTTSRLSFVTGKGKSAAPHANDASIQRGRKRWKPMSSRKLVRIPSKVVFNITKQTFSYDSFSSSPGTASPPLHLESTAAENSAGGNSANFFECSFDFDERDSFIGDLSIPNLFRSLETSDHGVEETSSASSESSPISGNPLPALPSEKCFIPSFSSIPTLDEALDQGLDDQEHVLSASAGIKFFESLQKTSSSNSSFVSLKSPSSCSSWKSPSRYGAFKSPSSSSASQSPNSSSAFKSPDSSSAFKSPYSRSAFKSPSSSSGFKLPGIYSANKSTESSVFQLPSSSKINECTDDGDTKSLSSMPSISDSSLKGGYHQGTLHKDSTNDKELSDAVIAWTLLGAVMGSPAPQSVLRAHKRRRGNESSNLWIDDNTTDELNENVINMDDVDLSDSSTSCPTSDTELQARSTSCAEKCVMTLEQRINFLAQLSRDENDAFCESNDSSSIPDVGDLRLIDPHLDCKVEPVFNSEIDNFQCSHVNLSSPADESDSDSVLDVYEDAFSTENVSAPRHSEDVASSAIAWGALAALLGSPAPSCVLQKKDRSAAMNLWIDCTTADGDDEIISLPCSEIDESSEGNILVAMSRDEELTDELSLSGLQSDYNDSCAVRKDEDNASSVLAWGALAALLGSPAPSCVLQKQSRPVKNLWADVDSNEDDDLISLSNSEGSFLDDSNEGGTGHLGSSAQVVNEPVDDLSLSSLRLDLCDSCEPTELKYMARKKDQITSTIAWGALTALLGLPAPTCVLQKNSRAVKNFWAGDDGNLDDDLISLAPSEDPHDGDFCEQGAYDVDSSLKESEFIDDLSLSALEVDSDDIYGGEEETTLTQTKSDITTPTIAWGALTALLGLPAPSCVLHKGNRHVKNLWAGDDDDDDGVVSLAHSQGSCLDDSDSVPSLIAESHVGSYPSSPSIRNVSSCESVSPFKDDNAVIDSFIEWGR